MNENKGSERREITDFYVFSEEIGRGSFSVVRKGRHKETGKTFAIKCIQKRLIKIQLLEREIQIMKCLKHPNILPLVEVFDNKDFIFLVLELVTGGELFDRIVERGNYSEKDASSIVNQILQAVQYLHSQGIVHRDLKPENLLVRDTTDSNIHIYVADFGLSRMFDDNQSLTTYCGSPEYVAPEVLSCVPYGKPVDLWSVGVITYILLTGFLPFYDKNHAILFEKIQRVEYNWDDCPEVTPTAKHFIQHLLVLDPAKRYSVESALNHPWVKGENVSKLTLRPSLRDLMTLYNINRKGKTPPTSPSSSMEQVKH